MATAGFFSASTLAAVLIGCGSAATLSSSASVNTPPPSTVSTTAATAPKSSATECTKVAFVDIHVKDVSESGAYEAIGTVDLSKPIDNEPFALSERIRRRACLQGGEAVGVLATESGTGTEYIVVRHRRAPAASSSGSAASKNVKIDYFPNAK